MTSRVEGKENSEAKRARHQCADFPREGTRQPYWGFLSWLGDSKCWVLASKWDNKINKKQKQKGTWMRKSGGAFEVMRVLFENRHKLDHRDERNPYKAVTLEQRQ